MIVKQSEINTWDEIIESHKDKPLQDDEITYIMFGEKTGCGYDKARVILKGMLKRGQVTRRAVVVNGRSTVAFRLVQDDLQNP